MDPMSKMLCGMLGVKPEELQTTIAGIGSAATWFKTELENSRDRQREILDNQAVIIAALGRIASNVAVDAVQFGVADLLRAGNGDGFGNSRHGGTDASGAE